MSLRPSQNDFDFIRQAVEAAIKARVAVAIEEETAAAAQRLAVRIKQETDHIVLSVFSEFSVERHGRNLLITVRGMPAAPGDAPKEPPSCA